MMSDERARQVSNWLLAEERKRDQIRHELQMWPKGTKPDDLPIGSATALEHALNVYGEKPTADEIEQLKEEALTWFIGAS